jgi:DNA primase
VAAYRRALLCSPTATEYLRGRGLRARTCRTYGLGYDANMDAITIPVHDAAGVLVTVRRRLLKPKPGGAKYLSMRGHPAQLYPDVPASGPLLLGEGELDALIGRQHGLPTITGTCGWEWLSDGSWDWAIQGRIVAVVYDAGDDGYERAKRRAADLQQRGARQAWPVDLAAAGLRDKEDLTDWFVKYGRSAPELRRLINRAGRRS